MARTPSPSSRRRGGNTLPPAGMCFYEVTVPPDCYVGETLYARILGQDEMLCLTVPEGVEAGDILVFAAEVGWGQQEPSCGCGERRRQRGAARASVVRGAWRRACRKLFLLPIVVAQRTVTLGAAGQCDDLTDRRVAQALQESIPRLSRRTEDGDDVYIEGAAGETLFEIEVPVLLPPAPSEILPGALLKGDTIMEVKVDSTAHRAGLQTGDTIVDINSLLSIRKGTHASLEDCIRSLPIDAASMTLTIRRGVSFGPPSLCTRRTSARL